MYYKGTKKECEDYNAKVTKGEKYLIPTLDYASIVSQKNGLEFAILAKDEYNSSMEIINAIPNSWKNNNQL
jgi:hypothetical protein